MNESPQQIPGTGDQPADTIPAGEAGALGGFVAGVSAGEAGSELAAAGPASGLRHHSRMFWREWLKPFLMVLVAVGSIRSAIADWNDVPTGSMRPSILEGDRIVVNKLAYDLKIPFTRVHLLEWSNPERGDIIVFFSPEDGKRLVKRVVGVPGDQIEVRANRIFIDGAPLPYQTINLGDFDLPAFRAAPWDQLAIEGSGYPVLFAEPWGSHRSFGPARVPAERYFVMGDNRDNSRDSRAFGFVPRDRIVGRATAVAASIDPDRFFLPRWERFLRALI